MKKVLRVVMTPSITEKYEFHEFPSSQFIFMGPSQLAFTCSKSPIEQGVKYVQS